MDTTDILAKLDQLDDLSRAIRAAVMAEETASANGTNFINRVLVTPKHWPALPSGDKWHNPNQVPLEKFGPHHRPLTEREREMRANGGANVEFSTSVESWKRKKWDATSWLGSDHYRTYRVPASWPIGHGIPNFNPNETQTES